MTGPLKWIDIPPLWLIGTIALAWAAGRADPAGLSFGYWPVVSLLAGLLIGAGLVLMALALYELRRWRTTPVPHEEATHLVTSGIFSRSRNPIYLGDALVLAGAILWLDAPLALPLVPLFVWLIERRFIVPEEDRLRRRFRADFARYCQKVRRWI